MSLIKCPQCNNTISEYSYECPHCHFENDNRVDYRTINISDSNYEAKYFSHGFEIVKKRKRKRQLLIVISILFVISIIGAILYNRLHFYKMIKQTDSSIEPYIELIGSKCDNGNYVIPEHQYDDFYENIDHVYLMGYTGAVSHNYETDTQIINFLQWVSNDTVSETSFEEFLERMNKYLGSQYQEDYDSTLPSSVFYRWNDTKRNLTVYSWYSSEKITVQWAKN